MNKIVVCIWVSVAMFPFGALAQPRETPETAGACIQASQTTVLPQSLTVVLEPIMQWASPTCQSCRNGCVDARVKCKQGACRSNGGTTDNPNVCNAPKNTKGFSDALKACEDQERSCLDRCNAGACK